MTITERFNHRVPPLGRHLLGAVLALVVVVLVLSMVTDYRRVQFAEMAALATAAGGLTVLTGINGQLSLGHGALMAFGAYTTALLLPDRESSVPLLVVIVAAVGVTTLVGAVVGVAAARLHGPYLAGATLALALAVPSIAVSFSDTFNGEQGLRVVMPEIPVWAADGWYFLTGAELTNAGWLALLSWTTLIVTYVVLANLVYTRVGRRWRAVRDDEVAAELAGIDLGKARVSAFMVSAAAAGAAGCMLSLVVRLAAPGSFMLTLSLTLVAAVVLGGLGYLTGAVIGAGLLAFLPQVATEVGREAGLSDIQAAELSPLVLGIVMVIVILIAPGGLLGVLKNWGRRVRSRFRRKPKPSLTTSAAAPAPTAPAPRDDTPSSPPSSTHPTAHHDHPVTTSEGATT